MNEPPETAFRADASEGNLDVPLAPGFHSGQVAWSDCDPALREVFTAVLDEHDSDLLHSLRTSGEPSQREREAVEDILSDAFSENIDDDGEPTGRGRLLDDALGKFLLRWPIDG